MWVNQIGEPDIADNELLTPTGTISYRLTIELMFYYNPFHNVYLETDLVLDRLAL